jgi:hypothetical protein
VLSCRIDRTADTVAWRDIRWEDDSCSDGSPEGMEQDDPDYDPIRETRIDAFTFDADQYERAIADYVRDLPFDWSSIAPGDEHH